MSTDDHWITARISEALTHHPLVTEAVSSRMAEALKGHLSEQQLSQMDLAKLARAFLTDMASMPPKTDAKQ